MPTLSAASDPSATRDRDEPSGSTGLGLQGVHGVLGASDYLTLSTFSGASSSAVFRKQHSEIAKLFDELVSSQSFHAPAEFGLAEAIRVRELVTVLGIRLHAHLSLEDAVIGKSMGSDPRHGVVADQFGRDSARLRAAFQTFSMRFPTPSAVLDEALEFLREIEQLRRVAGERFKAIVRDLYPAFDRLNTMPGAL
jgi:hypothetical protein